MQNNPLILFDGVCNLCNAFVRFVIKYDSKAEFMFGSMQSERGKEIVSRINNSTNLETVIVLFRGKMYQRSDAFLFIVRRLRFPVNLLVLAYVIPRIIRNAAYDFIAKRRYKIFGKSDECVIPTESYQNRFI
jgi:predicted DCC family thiol-disulfide oxidoreductase YuxK